MRTVSIRGGIFLFLGVLAVVLPTAPISTFPTLIETPDYLVCIIFVWLICEPKSAPFFSILFLSLLADILWQRPLGLCPIFVLLLTELIRFAQIKVITRSIFLKWGYFFLFLILLNIGINLFSLIAAVPPLEFKVWIKRFLFTIFTFPIVNILLEYTVFSQYKKLTKS